MTAVRETNALTQYMVNDLEAQTRAAMDGIKQTLDAAGASFKDVVHYFVFRARPRIGAWVIFRISAM